MDPSAFLSYAHDDDDGSIAAFKRLLEAEVRALTGKRFDVWFDKGDIEWGANWQTRITDSINDTTFLIPIITPRYFNQEPCREELQTFLNRLEKLKDKDALLLAVHYIEVPELLGKSKPEDKLIAAIWSRQWVDWRKFRNVALNSPKKQAFTNLAKKIVRAMLGPVGAEANRTAAPNALPSPEATAVASDSPIKRAYVLGCGRFDPAMKLNGTNVPKQNVAAVEQVLSKLPSGPFTTTPLVDAHSDEVRTVLQALVQTAGADDIVMIYYSGVASVSADDGVCLSMSNTKPHLLDSTALPLRWLKEKVTDRLKARDVIVVLDCTYQSANDGEQPDVSQALQTDLGKGKGKCLISASTAIGRPGDDANGRNSPFTKWMVQGITSWEADQNRDGVITLDELYTYVNCNEHDDVAASRPGKWDFELAEPGKIEIARRKQEATVGRPAESGVERFEQLADIRKIYSKNRLIPFLGDGIYGSGPLSSFALLTALSKQGQFEVTSQLTLATAAEYVQVLGSTGRGEEVQKQARVDFLEDFREILEDQSKAAEVQQRAVHDVVVKKMKPPWIMVSVTYDDVLERRLALTKERFVVLAHVLRAEKPEQRGKILLHWRGEPKKQPDWEIRSADDFTLSELAEDGNSYRVIYKVLGSPFLNRVPPMDLGIDTVVITESDHTQFLSYLDNQQTKVPEMFSRPFKAGAILFLGYNLDVWHYRLVARVFGRTLMNPLGDAFSVRQPTSPIEDRFWRSLGVELLRTDPETFAATLLD